MGTLITWAISTLKWAGENPIPALIALAAFATAIGTLSKSAKAIFLFIIKPNDDKPPFKLQYTGVQVITGRDPNRPAIVNQATIRIFMDNPHEFSIHSEVEEFQARVGDRVGDVDYAQRRDLIIGAGTDNAVISSNPIRVSVKPGDVGTGRIKCAIKYRKVKKNGKLGPEYKMEISGTIEIHNYNSQHAESRFQPNPDSEHPIMIQENLVSAFGENEFRLKR